MVGGTYNSLIEECALQGNEEEFNENHNEYFGYNDNDSNMINENMGMDDINTLQSNESALGNQHPGNADVALDEQDVTENSHCLKYIS